MATNSNGGLNMDYSTERPVGAMSRSELNALIAGGPSGSGLSGTGMPNGVVSAPPGIIYTDTAGTNGAWRWLKKSGTGNTGWVAIEGDTGWRDITATHLLRHTSGTLMPVISGTLHIRRINQTVQVSAYRLTLDRVAEPSELLRVNDAPGFAATANANQAGHWPWSRWDMTGQFALVRSGTGWIPGSAPLSPFPIAGGQGALTLHNWFTSDAWPTTLPGTAA